MKLDKEEQDLIKSIENDEWQSIEDSAELRKQLQQAARNTTTKNLTSSDESLPGKSRRP